MMILRERPVTSSSCLLHRDAFDDVAELHDAADLGEDRHRERIPLGEELCRPSTFSPSSTEELGAVDEAVALALAAGVVDDDELAVAVHHDQRAVACFDRWQRC